MVPFVALSSKEATTLAVARRIMALPPSLLPIPFGPFVRNLQCSPFVSFVPDLDMVPTTTTTKNLPLSLTTSGLGQKFGTASLLTNPTSKSAFPSTSAAPTVANVPTLETPVFIAAPSVEARPTTLSHGLVEPGPLPDVQLIPHTHLLNYPDLSSLIHRRPIYDPALHLSPNIFSRIIHPYDPDAFERALADCNLTHAYPNLVNQLRNGFPLGNLPEITHTIIHKSPTFQPEASASIFRTKYLQIECQARSLV